jgi:hypothetical protein
VRRGQTVGRRPPQSTGRRYATPARAAKTILGARQWDRAPAGYRTLSARSRPRRLLIPEAKTHKVISPDGSQAVEVRFLEDGSIRVRVPGAWFIEQAFISQDESKRAIIKFSKRS